MDADFRAQALIHRYQNKIEDHRTNHIKHFIFSVLTLGIWVPIWALIAGYDYLQKAKYEKLLNKALVELEKQHSCRAKTVKKEVNSKTKKVDQKAELTEDQGRYVIA